MEIWAGVNGGEGNLSGDGVGLAEALVVCGDLKGDYNQHALPGAVPTGSGSEVLDATQAWYDGCIPSHRSSPVARCCADPASPDCASAAYSAAARPVAGAG